MRIHSGGVSAKICHRAWNLSGHRFTPDMDAKCVFFHLRDTRASRVNQMGEQKSLGGLQAGAHGFVFAETMPFAGIRVVFVGDAPGL